MARPAITHSKPKDIQFRTPSNPEDKAHQSAQKNMGTNDDLEGRKYSYRGHENAGDSLDDENNMPQTSHNRKP